MQSLYAHFKESYFFPNRTSTLRAETCTPPSLSLSRSILPASQPKVSLSVVQEQALRSPLLSAMHYCDECVIGNSLTRGKGIKALKIVKTLLSTDSLFGVVAANQRAKKPKLPLSPERGLKRVSKRGVRFLGYLPPKLSSLVEIQHCLFSVLLIGCTIWWASHPAPERVLPSILSSLFNGSDGSSRLFFLSLLPDLVPARKLPRSEIR